MPERTGSERAMPFGAGLARGAGEAGRRQAQRRAHQFIFRTRRLGHAALADWIADGFSSGRLTDDGAAGDPFRLACTLAAGRLCEFIESAELAGRPRHGSATLLFDRIAGDGIAAPGITKFELADVEAGELHGTMLAGAFGVSGRADELFQLRHFLVDELAPDPRGGGGPGTLDLWEATPCVRRARELPREPLVIRVRMGYSAANGDVHLARLEQPFVVRHDAPHGPKAKRPPAVPPRLVLDGTPVITTLPDSRLAADRWDRLLLDGFVANQLASYLARRSALRTARPPG
jgi:hypothetical protein